MIKKIFLRICLLMIFMLSAYLIDAYIKHNASFLWLGIGLLGLTDTAITMFKTYEKY